MSPLQALLCKDAIVVTRKGFSWGESPELRRQATHIYRLKEAGDGMKGLSPLAKFGDFQPDQKAGQSRDFRNNLQCHQRSPGLPRD